MNDNYSLLCTFAIYAKFSNGMTSHFMFMGVNEGDAQI